MWLHRKCSKFLVSKGCRSRDAGPWNLKNHGISPILVCFDRPLFPGLWLFSFRHFDILKTYFILNMMKPQQVQVYQLINVISMVGHTKNVRIRVVTIRQNVTSVLSSIFEVILVNDLTNVTNVNMLQSLLVIWRSTIEPTLARNHSNVHIVTMHAEQGEI